MLMTDDMTNIGVRDDVTIDMKQDREMQYCSDTLGRFRKKTKERLAGRRLDGRRARAMALESSRLNTPYRSTER